jgi:hypothetical protein
MDKINSALNRQTKQPYHSAIQAAMKLAAKKLDRYYSLTDLSDAYRIAMGMYQLILLTKSKLSCSPSSRSQARVFSTTGLGGRVDPGC